MQPNKSLGQNFLSDKTILSEIVRSANLRPTDLVVEVGPGGGVLTKELAHLAQKVLAIEIDEKLSAKLKQRWSKNKKISIITADILKINLPKLLEKNSFNDYLVVANIPYYITSPIIRLFLETSCRPKVMLLMIQKEVAERICAKPGKLSILALSVQYYATPELLFFVPKTAFTPIPEVDSAVLRVTLNPEREEKEKAKKFFKLVRAGFLARRKTLANNLSSSLRLEKSLVEEKLRQIGIKPNQRAQELSLENWQDLAKLF